MSPISKLARFQPLNLAHTNAPDAPNHQKLFPPQYFARTPTSLDPADSANAEFSSFPTPDDRNHSLRCQPHTIPATTPPTPPTVIVRPLSIQIPKAKNQHFKSKGHFFNYYQNLISYNNLLKKKEIYLNNLLMECHSQALFINVSSP